MVTYNRNINFIKRLFQQWIYISDGNIHIVIVFSFVLCKNKKQVQIIIILYYLYIIHNVQYQHTMHIILYIHNNSLY